MAGSSAQPARELVAVTAQHLAQVKSEALAQRSRLPGHMNVEDLVSAGSWGLALAALRFDGRSIQFWSFAKYRVQGCMRDEIRSEIGRGRVQRHHLFETLPLEEMRGFPARTRPNLLQQLEVAQLLGKLPSRQRLVLQLLFFEGWTIRAIGARMRVSHAQVAAIKKAALLRFAQMYGV